MPQIVGLASLSIALFVVPLVAARAVLAGIVSLLLKPRHRRIAQTASVPSVAQALAVNPQG